MRDGPADTGIGIPPEDLPHIFDASRQGDRQGGEQTEGTGLGVAIAKKTVELLGANSPPPARSGWGRRLPCGSSTTKPD